MIESSFAILLPLSISGTVNTSVKFCLGKGGCKQGGKKDARSLSDVIFATFLSALQTQMDRFFFGNSG
jgi:hypothetical protein